MHLRLHVCLVFLSLWLGGAAQAQDLTTLVAEGNYGKLGGETVSATATLPQGFVPVNSEVAYVFDPGFHFFMRGYAIDATHDRRAQYRSFGYVVVAAAGDPGGNYQSAPWITHTGFSASQSGDQVTLSYSYDATYVPTLRGYQSFVIYANLKPTAQAQSLYVFDDKLTFGPGNYLFTGDGMEQSATLDLWASDVAQGTRAIRVRTGANPPGTHWKLMLFANGRAAAHDGVDLRAYKKLVFYAKASRANVKVQGGFGTGDDTGHLPIAPITLGTKYQRFEIDISGVNRANVNTPFWIYLHKSVNANLSNVSVFFDAIELVGDGAADDAVIVVDQGADSLDGTCAANGSRTGRCNLRAALALASDVSGTADIRVEADQSIKLGQISVSAESQLVTISGNVPERKLEGNELGRLFYVEPDATLTLANLTVRKFSSPDGGAILNDGTLTLDRVVVTENSARSFGTGAMTSFAFVSGGAVSNRKKLVLRGATEFRVNVALASSSTASFTNATAGAGAILNSGELVIDGPVLFAGNSADADAISGPHSNMPTGASASATGGAIWNVGGSLSVTGSGLGQCVFMGNQALATAQPADGSAGSASTSGGAISSTVSLNLPAGACSFSENEAQVNPDIHVQQP